ncbi:MAG: hypothetical protein R6V12_09120 [Candidatus Hydrogenedentota bacterium]
MRYLISIILVLLASGCGLDLLAGTAIQGTLQKEAASGAKKAIDDAQDTTSRMSIEQAINAYAAETGEYPESLDVLVPEWLPRIPQKADGTAYGYDPETGALLDGPVEQTTPEAGAESPPEPGLLDSVPLRESNQERLLRIHEAITEYTVEKGKYPQSLRALVPDYLPEYIKTRDGQDFNYDPATGIVSTPAPLPAGLESKAPASGQQQPRQPARRRQRRTPAAGGGPMGEALTGIGIQQELNRSVGGGGAGSTARRHMRRRSNEAVKRRNRQQEEALRELNQ